MNADGYLAKRYRYDAFGNIISETGPTFNRGFTYTSRERHARSGFYYYRARFYDPATGRFLTPDPIGHLGGVNLYAYVGNSPVDLVDPLGLTPRDRVKWALEQWFYKRDEWKDSDICNEYVAEAHTKGDPDVEDYPRRCWRVRQPLGPRYPLVEDLANRNFASPRLQYLPIGQAQAGDIIVWFGYGGGVHHSAIFIGNGEVIYQNKEKGVKRNTVEVVSKKFQVDPIVRRYIYPRED